MQEYIIKRTAHPVATGGSPIVTWLPNQLDAVLQQMITTDSVIDRNALQPQHRVMVEEIALRAEAQQRVLKREVAKLSQERGANAVENDAVERSGAASYAATA